MVATLLAACSNDDSTSGNERDEVPAEHLEVPEELLVTVPNLVGSCVEDALELARTLRLDVGADSSASGIVVQQDPAPGDAVESGTQIEIVAEVSPECSVG